MAAGNDAASTIKRMFSGSHDTRSKWQYFDAEWDYAICGDFGGHMPEGFDQASEM